ncbi:MAG TPA: FAD-dependent monooxygenase, partial [Gaiellaceae bacterium]|nr:FAD-dependent monooxygenase [Gaiellaceae bacterium]
TGASIDLGPNAIRLLDALDLADVRTVGVRPDAVELRRWDDGSTLLRAPHGAAAEKHFGAPLLDFYRPDLHELLLRALPDGVIRFGAWAAAVEQDDSQATLVLADGSRMRADAVVAADGIRSRLRQQLVGADEPEFSGTVVYRGLAAKEAVNELHPDHVNTYWLGPNRHAVAYWIAAGDLLAVNAAIRDADWARESWTDEAPLEEVLPAFEGWNEQVLERFRRCRVFLRGAVFVRRPLAHWSFGRITLLGDAAHAMEPFQAQGAAQAIEDAYVLGECLGGAPTGEVVEALRRYERLRMQRAEEMQDSSRAAADTLYLPDGDQQRARDERYRSLLDTYPWGHRQPLWEHDVRAALAEDGSNLGR